MKRISKRTMAWGLVAVCFILMAAFADSFLFAEVESEKTTAEKAEAGVSNNSLENLLKENMKAGGSTLSFESAQDVTVESVLLAEDSKAGVATIEAMNAPVVTAAYEKVPSAWDDKAIANVKSQVNVRAKASADSDIVGKFRRGNKATVLERGNEWTLISSGDVKGYVKNDYLLFGEEAEAFSKKVGNKIATVKVDGLYIRKSPSTDAGIHTQAMKGEEFTYTSIKDGWVKVVVSGEDEPGYVKADYVKTELKLETAITLKEEQELLEAEERAKEEAAREKAEEKAKKESKRSSVKKTKVEAVDASVDDLTLLAAVIEMEAGTHYKGGVAVGNVVLNRVNSSHYPDSIRGVVYQRGQFPGARNGKLAKILARGPKKACYKSAQAALDGVNYAGNRKSFNSKGAVNYSRIDDYVIIGGNCFY